MKYGKRVFVDKNNLEISKYPEQLQNAIENSNAFVLILNEDSWRQDKVIDVYYDEIIRIAKTQRNILPIEYVSGTLRNIPQILTDELAKENCKLSDFEKIIVYQNPYYNFEKELCSKIGVAYQAIDQNLPKFTMSKLDSLIDRDKIDELNQSVLEYRFSNLVGIGGSGKTSLTYRWAEIYGELFNNIALVTVNNSIKDDFVDSMDKTLRVCQAGENVDERYNHIFDELKRAYNVGNNLLVLDLNEASDKDSIYNFINGLIEFPNNWKFLILSREKVRNDCRLIDLNDDVDKIFMKNLFVEKAGKRYENFEDFEGLFELIKYSPLLAEQLGIYLKTNPGTESLDGIRKILYSNNFRERERKGVTTLYRTDNENTIIGFLNNLVIYKKFRKSERILLRHFVLWKAEYIEYKVIKELLDRVFDNYYDNFFQKLLSICHIKSYTQTAEEVLKSALDNLEKRSILNFDETKSAYKLHGLLADSLREQIDVTKQDYKTYFDNIKRIEDYNFREFLPYADCIGNSLCEYKITTWVDFLHNTAAKFYETWKTDYAQKLYDKCIEISNQRLKTEPENIEYLEDLSYAYNNLAILQENRLNDYESAEKNYNNAIEIDERIIKISDTPKYLNSLATDYNYLANLQQANLNDPKSAETNYKKAIEIREKITESSDDPEYLNDLAGSYYNLAMLQKNSLNDYDSAEIHYDKAIKIGEEIREVSDNPEYLNQLSAAYNNLASLQKNQNRYDSAIDNCKKAIEIRDNIKDTNLEYLVGWMVSKGMLADLYIATDKPTDARAIVDEIKPEAEKWLEKIPNYGYLKQVYGWIKNAESKLNQ